MMNCSMRRSRTWFVAALTLLAVVTACAGTATGGAAKQQAAADPTTGTALPGINAARKSPTLPIVADPLLADAAEQMARQIADDPADAQTSGRINVTSFVRRSLAPDQALPFRRLAVFVVKRGGTGGFPSGASVAAPLVAPAALPNATNPAYSRVGLFVINAARGANGADAAPENYLVAVYGGP